MRATISVQLLRAANFHQARRIDDVAMHLAGIQRVAWAWCFRFGNVACHFYLLFIAVALVVVAYHRAAFLAEAAAVAEAVQHCPSRPSADLKPDSPIRLKSCRRPFRASTRRT